MNDTISLTDLLDEHQKLTGEVKDLERLINRFCKRLGREPHFAETDNSENQTSNTANKMKIRPDQWFGKQLATCVGEYLSMRKAANLESAPATIEEIVLALTEGGYSVEGDPKFATRAIAIQIGKNSSKFCKIGKEPRYGLRAWYPNAKINIKPKSSSPTEQETEESKSAEEDMGPEEDNFEEVAN